MSIWLPVIRRWDTRRLQAGAPTDQPSRSEDTSYIDGFVIAVPTPNKQKLIEHARQLDPILDPSTPGNPPMPFDGKRMIVVPRRSSLYFDHRFVPRVRSRTGNDAPGTGSAPFNPR
jgi:hypothetical protein